MSEMINQTMPKAGSPPTIRVITQGTPNPNAMKFIVAKDVKSRGKATYSHPAECLHVPLACDLLGLPHVLSVHLFENVVTVNQDGEADWTVLEESVVETIKRLLPDHDPSFEGLDAKAGSENWDEERKRLEDILDREIRPGLQADGGDIQVIDYLNSVLTVRYEGACGSCPSARSGTLQGIESILRQEFNPEVQIVTLD